MKESSEQTQDRGHSKSSVRPAYLIILAVLSSIYLLADATGLLSRDQQRERGANSVSTAPARFLRVRFLSPAGIRIDPDATQHDAIELRDAALTTPVDMQFRTGLEYSLNLDSNPDQESAQEDHEWIMSLNVEELSGESSIDLTTLILTVELQPSDFQAAASGSLQRINCMVASSGSHLKPEPDSILIATLELAMAKFLEKGVLPVLTRDVIQQK